MLFDIHVPGKTGAVFNMRTHGDIVFILDTFQCYGPEIQAVFKVHPVRKSEINFQGRRKCLSWNLLCLLSPAIVNFLTGQAKGQALMFIIKAVWPTRQPAGGEGRIPLENQIFSEGRINFVA